jgi:hypothetical protein
LKTDPGVELFLSRYADGEWQEVVRPWLEARPGGLARSVVVAPTRGQTQALKQRCLCEGVALLGVEFLTPGLARKKRLAASGIGRTLQLLVLRSRIEACVAPLGPDDRERGLWKSLESDLESALADFEDLIRGGFRAEHFPRPELRRVFAEMASWMEEHGYALGPLQDEIAGLSKPGSGESPLADRLLVLAGGAEGWGEFFGLVALARRCGSVSVVLAEPDFRGGGGSGEEWINVWQTVLGVEARVIDANPADSCAGVADLWNGDGGSAERADVIVGRSKSDEMDLVARSVVRLLAEGSDNIAVIFPGAGAAHARMARLLEERDVPFADLIGMVGTAPVDTLVQRALADFYERGCRLEELLALWPLLRSLNLAHLPPADARRACQKLFDEVLSHSLEPHVGRLEESEDPHWREVGRVARLLMPGWPQQLAPSEALDRFEAARDRLSVGEPAGWSALREFARRATEPMPARAILEAIRSFLPEKGPAAARAREGFCRVTLTTCRRAAGVAWSDVIFTGANRGVWPEKREPSCWLGDDSRRELERAQGRFSLGLPTSDDRAAFERRLYCSIARDTRRRVAFSAALFSDEEPELALGPNPWLERVMWSKGLMSAAKAGSEAFERLARSRPAGQPAGDKDPLDAWLGIWSRRRDRAAPFDEYFLGEPGCGHRPDSLSASQIERGVEDPATLWFDALLRVSRVDWRPFTRARKKSIGNAVHRALAAAFRGAPVEGSFLAMPDRDAAAARLEGELRRIRALWPADRYWDSFHGDVSRAARELLERVFELPAAGYCAVEVRLPMGSSVPLGGVDRIAVHGRMDLVLSDRPGWGGARIEVVDFKTGGASKLSAVRMASTGASLQLGVYLEAVRSVGATGSVWMLKPEERPAMLGTDELERSCSKLVVLGAHLQRGIYGARTADRSEYSHGFEWPLACAPIAAAILESKFSLTFGAVPQAEALGGDDE